MSSLQRYKKSGGFVQLVSLLETFGPQKKEKFLEMIEGENVVWAKALREKMLTVERIFQWPDQVVIEVFKALPPKNLALALEGVKPEQKARLLVFFSASEKRRMDDLIEENKPKPEEISANMVKIIELTRKMMVQGDLRAEKFDEAFIIPEDIESKLEGQGLQAAAEKIAEKMTEEHGLSFGVYGNNGGSTPNAHSGNAPSGDHHGNAAAAHSPDVVNLQRSLGMLMKENKTLKDEVRILRDKLEAIRKIA